MVWPMLRWPLAQQAARRELGTNDSVPRPRWQSRMRQLRAALPVARRASRARGPVATVFLVGGTTVSGNRRNVTNWLIDPLARASGDAVVLQDARLRGAPAFERTYTLADLLTRLDAGVRARPLSTRDRKLAEEAVTELTQSYPAADADPATLRRLMVHRLTRAAMFEREMERLIDRLGPRLVVMEEAAYGSRGHLIAALRARGIRVAEPQHGVIGPSHAAYNYGAAWSAEELARHLPHELLTFGEFWSDELAWPARAVAVGKPHLSAQASSAPPLMQRDRAVLVASSMFQRADLIATATRIRDLLPEDWTVLIRPHPAERDTAQEVFAPVLSESRIALDLGGDVYRTFGRVRGVVGYISTVSYEALAFELPSVILDSPTADLYMPREIFGERVRDDADLAAAVDAIVAGGHPSGDWRRVWADDPEARFAAYLEEVTR
jgi:hypothetical protein